MKKILFFICATMVALSSCKKDKDTSSERLVGVWIGEKALVTLYADNGIDIIQETTVSLKSPNYAKAVFNADGSFTVDVKLVTPESVNESQQGTYKVNGSQIVLNVDGQETMEVLYSLNDNTLTVTLGTPGESLLKYTFNRE